VNIFIAITAIVIFWRLVSALEMELLSKIFGGLISVGFIALIVVFQPEIRRFLLLLGTPNSLNTIRSNLFFWRFRQPAHPKLNINEVVKACTNMASKYTGALIVITRNNELNQFIDTGVALNAEVNAAVLENIFFKNAPLHDGAVIIHKNKLKAARCVLPITRNRNFPQNYGLRHRAAVGISEQTDAIALIVSEETGKISYASHGSLHLHLTPEQLKTFLHEQYDA
jgi:uncharacterized protein (TIGR00159 family)